jgi:cysteine-rich repeat protein
MTCDPCLNTLCYTCNVLNTYNCLSCATNFQLITNNCYCDMTALTKVFVSNSSCYLCSDLQPECISCQYGGDPMQPYNSSDFTCLDCNNTGGYFIDMNNNCSSCSIAQCITCTGYSTCGLCNPGYGINAAGACSLCPLTGCSVCLSLTVCKTCIVGYQLVGGTTCSLCAQTCLCGGYTFPYLPNGDCSAVCGDSILISPWEKCDDGNTISGDGCSSTCQIEANSSCTGLPSKCYLNIKLNAILTNTVSSFTACNQITFTFQIIPNLLFFQNEPVSWINLITADTSILT